MKLFMNIAVLEDDVFQKSHIVRNIKCPEVELTHPSL